MKSSVLAQPQTIKNVMPSSNWSITLYIADLVNENQVLLFFRKPKCLLTTFIYPVIQMS